MNEKRKAGLITSLLVGLHGLFGSFIVFSTHWEEMYWAKAAQNRPDETVVIRFVIPALHDLSVIGSIIMLVAAFMFYKKYKHAWHTALIGNILAIQGTGFPIVAGASAGLFPKYLPLFIVNMIAFYLYIAYIRKLSGKIISLATLVGMTYVVALFNGIAALSRFFFVGGIEGGSAKFVASQQINWVGVIFWFVFLLGLLFEKKWIFPIGLAASIMTIVGGIQLAYDSMAREGGFSMFAVAPIFSTIILIYILLPTSERLVNNWAEFKQ